MRSELNNSDQRGHPGPSPAPPPRQWSPEPGASGHMPRSSGVGIMGNIKPRSKQDRDYNHLPTSDRGMHHSRSLDRTDSLDRADNLDQQHTVHHRAGPPGPPMARPMSPGDNGGMSPPPYGPGYSASREPPPPFVYSGAGGVFRGKLHLPNHNLTQSD